MVNVARWFLGSVLASIAAMALIACDDSSNEADAKGPDGGKEGGSGESASATATIAGKSGSNVTGTATFTMSNGKVTFNLAVEGAPPGEHAVHIHEMGDCSPHDATSAGGHWNPTAKEHGQWGTGAFHLGDIGNMKVDGGGKGTITLTTDLWSVGTKASNDVVGHALMIHADPDDFKTQPTGNAGARIGCGVIALAQKGAK